MKQHVHHASNCCHHRSPPQAPDASADDRRIYTCPMDPEVEQIGPGACPICGMALEPKEIQITQQAPPELKDMGRRFKISSILSAPLLLIGMADMIPLPSFRHFLLNQSMVWSQFALATPVFFWSG